MIYSYEVTHRSNVEEMRAYTNVRRAHSPRLIMPHRKPIPRLTSLVLGTIKKQDMNPPRT